MGSEMCIRDSPGSVFSLGLQSARHTTAETDRAESPSASPLQLAVRALPFQVVFRRSFQARKSIEEASPQQIPLRILPISGLRWRIMVES